MKPILTAEQVTRIRLSVVSDSYWANLLGVDRCSVKRARVGRTHQDNPTPAHPDIRRPRFDTGAKRDGQPAEVDLASISLPAEEWRPVVGWERFYRVSDMGRVYSLHQTGRLTVGMRMRGGYHVVKLRDGERRGNMLVHCMVLEAFRGPRPGENFDGCHGDGNPENSRLDNLRWDTKSANQADRLLHGTSKMPRVLTADLVRQIRTATGISDDDWAQRLGCSTTVVFFARIGKTWKTLDTPPLHKRPPRTVAEQLDQPALLTDRMHLKQMARRLDR